MHSTRPTDRRPLSGGQRTANLTRERLASNWRPPSIWGPTIRLSAAMFVLALGVACSDGEPTSPVDLPEVLGTTLDQARADLEAAGFDVEVEGGGVFGVVEEANWEVCGQEPTGRTAQPGSTVTLHVDRTCEEEGDPDAEPTPTPGFDLEGVDLRILADRLDLTNQSEDEWRDCRVTINPRGIVRRLGYDRMLPSDLFGPGDYIGLPYGSFTNRDGERFNIAERAVERVRIECMVGDEHRSGLFGPSQP